LPVVAAHQSQQRFLFAFRRLHFKIQIWPVKSGLRANRIPQRQQPHNILTDLLRRRCGKGRHRRPMRQRLNKLGDLQIAWPEILPPLRNTVRLVHCN
jgi:hypothetical protein